MISYSIRMPDMSRNTALAGQTVSTGGMNVTYNEKGYAVKATNYGHKTFAGTSRSIRAASKEAVLAGGSRAGYEGPKEDLAHFSDRELAYAARLRGQVAAGEMSESEANGQLEQIRRMYGYTYGANGNQYAAIILPDERPEDVAMAHAQSVTAQEASVQSAAPSREAEAQSAAPSREAEDETERLRESWRTQLYEQQQSRSVQSELEELRVQDMIRVNGKEIVSKALLELMDEDDD